MTSRKSSSLSSTGSRSKRTSDRRKGETSSRRSTGTLSQQSNPTASGDWSLRKRSQQGGQNTLNKTRRGHSRQTRLSWPIHLSNKKDSLDLQQSQDEDYDKKIARGKRPLSITRNSKNGVSDLNKQNRLQHNHSCTNNSLWTEQFAPTASTDLCVAPKKVQIVQSWLTMHRQTTAPSFPSLSSPPLFNNATTKSTLPSSKQQQSKQQQQQPTHPSNILILIGSPGIGKSTMVRVLAKELKLNILEWKEESNPFQSHLMDGSYSSADLWTSPLASFEMFLQQTCAGFSSLATTTTAAVEPVANNGLYLKLRHKRHRLSKPQNESPPSSLILLEELPNLHGPDAEQRFRAIFSKYLLERRRAVPTIFIYSNVSEGKHNPADLEKLIDPQHLYNPNKVQLLQIHPVTKSKWNKMLPTILLAHSRDDSRHVGKSIKSLQGPSSRRLEEFWEQLHEQSGGDIRHGIMTLQLEICGTMSSRSNNQQSQRMTRTCASFQNRDVRLSSFHALGKLLYAKRQASFSEPATGRGGKEQLQFVQTRTVSNTATNTHNPTHSATTPPPLAFDPEQVMEQSEMEMEASLGFLEYHCVDFFNDITELSKALEFYSDAALLLDDETSFFQRNRYSKTTSTSNSSIFPMGYVASLSGRAVATTNKHPTEGRFRQFVSPKLYSMIRNRRHNNRLLQQLSQQCWVKPIESSPSSSSLSSPCVGGFDPQSTTVFVKDILPLARHMVPSYFEPTLNQLLDASSSSFNDNAFHNGPFPARKSDSDKSWFNLQQQQGLDQQNEILAEDDIVEDDEDEANDRRFNPTLHKGENVNDKLQNGPQQVESLTSSATSRTTTSFDSTKLPPNTEEIIVIDSD